MVLSIIFLEDKHKVLLHLSILYEYQQFFPTPYLILDTAATNLRVEVGKFYYNVEKKCGELKNI
jgi:hypothetical protein